jgi:Na+-transporting methylmalonyl-CoA/oxaloacetate decarboxylase gamma subunit
MNSVSLYWILKLDDIRTVVEGIGVPFLVIGILFLVGFIISEICFSCFSESSYDKDAKDAAKTIARFTKPYAFVLTIVGAIFTSGSYLIPSTQQFAIMYVVPTILNNDNIKEVPKKLVDLAGEWIEEMRPGNIKESAKTIGQQTNAKTAE